MTTAERVVLAVEALEREVNHDGYDGLFTNASEEVPYLVSSLLAIGAEAAADLTRSAIAILGIEGPLSAEAVAATMERDDSRRDDALDALDQRFYKEIRGVDTALLPYIRANRDQISLP